jgi:hypothetical protein
MTPHPTFDSINRQPIVSKALTFYYLFICLFIIYLSIIHLVQGATNSDSLFHALQGCLHHHGCLNLTKKKTEHPKNLQK